MEGNNNIQDNQNVQNKKNEKTERQGRGLFYFVIAFAVIIIAVVGATYAYFTSEAYTDENQGVAAGSTKVELGISVDTSGINYNLIPVADEIAKYAYAKQLEVKTTCEEYKDDSEGNSVCIKEKKAPGSTCVDQTGAEVCSAYTFTVSSSSSSGQTLTMYLGTRLNGFANLYFAVYTDTEYGRTRVSDVMAVATEAGTTNSEVEIKPIVVDGNEEQSAYFANLAYPTLSADEPTKTYTIVLWIHEIDDDQTLADGDKVFDGYIRISSADGGVTGEISQSNNYDNTEFDFFNSISLSGSNNVTVDLTNGDTYEELGVIVTALGNTVSEDNYSVAYEITYDGGSDTATTKTEVEEKINAMTAGTYTIKYTITYNNEDTILERTVEIQ